MSDKKCPNCGLFNPPSAMRCDCGFDFESSSMKESYATGAVSAEAKERADRNLPTLIARGVVILVVYTTLASLTYLLFGVEPRSWLMGLYVGIGISISMLVKIKPKRWF